MRKLLTRGRNIKESLDLDDLSPNEIVDMLQKWAKDVEGNKKYSFDVYERARSSRDEASIDTVIDFIKNDGEELDNSVYEYISDTAYDLADYFLKDEGFNSSGIDEIKQEYADEYEELRFAMESNANVDITVTFPTEIFFYDPDEVEIYEDAEEESEELKEFIEKGKKAGFSDKEITQVIEEASYGGAGGVGIIANGQKLIPGESEVSGNVILYIIDRNNGSGSYYLGKKYITLKYKNTREMANSIDVGSYSLGDVFGTSDWTWR